ncbi:MAG TPA: DUF5985 family protein [Steroidobacteraceae bacterium]|nr:DUF5985 family protein [Steroidobacteraceae bacterium]
MLEGFLLGVIVTASLTAAAFFFKFWIRTRDGLFLAFGAAFLIEGLNRAGLLFLEHPNEGRPEFYLVRLLAFVLIAVAIIKKNRGA